MIFICVCLIPGEHQGETEGKYPDNFVTETQGEDDNICILSAYLSIPKLQWLHCWSLVMDK